MARYVIRSDYSDDPAYFGYLHGITIRPSYIDVDFRGPMSEPMLFDSYAEGCAVIAFIVAFIDSSYDSLAVIPLAETSVAIFKQEESNNGI